MIDRETWQGVRDGAGVKKGYTKASIGDLIDRWRDLMYGKGPKVILKTIRALRRKLKIVKIAGTAELKAATINLYAAAMEYQDKFVKEKGLAVVPQKKRPADEARSLPYYLYTAVEYTFDGTKTPQKHLVATLNTIRNHMVETLRRLGGDSAINELVKAHPKAKPHLDACKDDGDPLPTRDQWKAHRDGAGIPQGWVKGASIGETLAAFRAAAGDLSDGLDRALENIADDAMKPVQTAAFQLYLAAARYEGKLKKEKKDTGKGQNVADDLKAMKEVALRTLGELDFREETIQEMNRMLAELQGV